MADEAPAADPTAQAAPARALDTEGSVAQRLPTICQQAPPARALDTEGATPQKLVAEWSVVPELDLGKENWAGKTQVHRIKTAAALKKLGGKTGFAFDFGSHDLVVVKGSLGCSKGKVECSVEKDVVVFSVQITERCNHLKSGLHYFPYAAAFAVAKSANIHPAINIGGQTDEKPRVDKAQLNLKLEDTGATHLNLAGLGLTNEDLVKLKEFKNLTHLYLGKNHVTDEENQITDEGLANLSHMSALCQLFLDGNAGITDAGLVHLKGIMTSRISFLGLTGTGITQAGRAQLDKWAGEQTNEFSTHINDSIVVPTVHE